MQLIRFVLLFLRFVLYILRFNNVECWRYKLIHNTTLSNRYGVITRMFLHSFWPDAEAPKKIVVQADWYEQVGKNPVNGLPQIRFQANFSACSLAFLDDCIAENCAFFPSDPWNDKSDLFDVVLHHSSPLYDTLFD